MMKNTKTILWAIVIIISTSVVSCDTSFERVTLEDITCSCGGEMEFINEIKIDSILLLDSAKLSFEEMKAVGTKGLVIKFICINMQTEDAFLFYEINDFASVPYFGHICNFPFNTVNKWDVPASGVYTKISADSYESCLESSPLPYRSDYSDLVLKSLKKYTE